MNDLLSTVKDGCGGAATEGGGIGRFKATDASDLEAGPPPPPTPGGGNEDMESFFSDVAVGYAPQLIDETFQL